MTGHEESVWCAACEARHVVYVQYLGWPLVRCDRAPMGMLYLGPGGRLAGGPIGRGAPVLTVDPQAAITRCALCASERTDGRELCPSHLVDPPDLPDPLGLAHPQSSVASV